MEITTILGIVVAVVIMLLGIRLLLKKPAEVSPSLETDLHIHPDSQQPVIPRHVREQLQTEAEVRKEPVLAEAEPTEAKEAQPEPVTESATNDANVGRFCNLVKELSEQVQFIYITHNKLAMTMATDLLGVTMPEPGTSKLVTVNLEQAKEYGLVSES